MGGLPPPALVPGPGRGIQAPREPAPDEVRVTVLMDNTFDAPLLGDGHTTRASFGAAATPAEVGHGLLGAEPK